MFSCFVTLSFQAAHRHALRQLPLHADVQNQGGQHHQHKACVHGAVLRRTLLRLHQVQQADRQGAGCAGRTHEGHGNDILVPEGQEVEQDNGDDGRLCHGEDDASHGGEIARTVDVGRLLKVVRQSGEIARQQIDRKRRWRRIPPPAPPDCSAESRCRNGFSATHRRPAASGRWAPRYSSR